VRESRADSGNGGRGSECASASQGGFVRHGKSFDLKVRDSLGQTTMAAPGECSSFRSGLEVRAAVRQRQRAA
jgi:hypothetical protein